MDNLGWEDAKKRLTKIKNRIKWADKYKEGKIKIGTKLVLQHNIWEITEFNDYNLGILVQLRSLDLDNLEKHIHIENLEEATILPEGEIDIETTKLLYDL